MSASRSLVDAAARARAITGLEVSMALSAGAGSGKTSVLAGRIVEALRRGTPPARLAAITFTEKAAGELLVRVRDLLEAALRSTTIVAEDRARLAAALARFGELTITTIHGFCRDLLRREAFAAGFAPATIVGERAELQAIYERALASWQRQLRQKRSHLARIVEAKTSRATRLTALQHLDSHRGYRAVADDAVAFDLDAARADLLPSIAAIAAAAKACTAPTSCVLLRNSQPLVDRLGAIHDEREGHRHLLQLLIGDTAAAGRGGRAQHWPGESKARYLDALKAVLDWRARWLSAAWSDVVRSLVDDVLPAVAAARDDEGLAGFDDLLIETAALLRTDDEARHRLARTFPVVLIDEVQDTDPIQAEIAVLLGLDVRDDPDDPDDPDADEPTSTLFAVGDPRQSIYRFRGADVATFGALEERIIARGEQQALTTNFRSVDGLVRWVNHVYGPAVGGMADYVAQAAWRAPALLDPVVLLQGDDDDDLDEIDAAIAHLRQLLSQPGAVHDADGRARPLRGSDMMILLPSWGSADTIADRLRGAGLPCVVEGGGAFYRRDEVRLLVAATRVLADPADTASTLLVLRGLFGLSIGAIAAHIGRGGSLRISVPTTLDGPVADAINVLAALHRRRGQRSLSGLLSSLLATTKTLAVWALLPGGAARSANVDKLLSIVRDLEAEHTSPLAVVAALTRQEKNRSGDKDIDRVDDDGDAIRVTTLFKAKGLEAPLVFVMYATRGNDGVELVVDHAARRVVVRVGDLQPIDWEQQKLVELEQARQERQRWMYVAATRARDQLVICRTTTKRKQPKLFDTDIAPRGLPDVEALPAHDTLWHADDAKTVVVRVRHVSRLSASAVKAADATFGPHDAAIDALLAGMTTTTTAATMPGDIEGARFVERHRQLVRQAQRRSVRWRAATATPGGSRGDRGEAATTETTTTTLTSTSTTAPLAVGARVGVVVHEVMERLDLSQPAALLSQQARVVSTQLATRAALSKSEADAVVAVVTRILRNPLVDEARRAPERFAEVPFSFPEGGTIVAGTIDLLFPLDDTRRRWAVFDWKSTVPATGTPQRARYEAQLARYAQAVLRTLGDVEIVTAIVGPHDEAGPLATIDDALQLVPSTWREAVGDLVARGAAVPVVGGELEADLAAVAELAWPAQKVAVGVDVDGGSRTALAVLNALATRGWHLCDDIDEAAKALALRDDDDDDTAGGDDVD